MKSHPKARITTLGKKLFELKREKVALEEQVKKINDKINKIATVELAEIMQHAEVEKLTIKDFGTIYMRDDFFCNVLKDNREDLHAWLRESGNGELIVDYVQPSTFKAFVREQLENGGTLPEYVQVRFVPTVQTMKSTSK